jgi:anti-sigma regulatory factor (Ser/Thr protein kinase)
VLDLTPDDIVGQLDAVAHSLDGVQLATCLYVVYDPLQGVLSYASAGHLPPALRHPDGSVEYLELPSGAPLGVGGVPFESAETTVPDGAVLALYTDGLVEARDQDLDTGLGRLAGALADAPDALEDVCDAMLRALGRTTAHSDDVALLVARMTGVPAERQEAWRVDPDLSAVSRARAITTRALSRWRLDPLEENAVLLVSELVTNAIRYARHPVTLRLAVLDDRLVCSVQDQDARLPRLRRAGADDEGGRGLYLVGTLARRWGTRPTASGKVVWFELPLPSA